MKSIIIGGGKIGSNLLKTLKERGYDVTLIEKNEEICRKIANDIEADIICGDGTDLDVLHDAGIKNADLLAAVTGKDEENLVICQIAERSGKAGVPKKPVIPPIHFPKISDDNFSAVSV